MSTIILWSTRQSSWCLSEVSATRSVYCCCQKRLVSATHTWTLHISRVCTKFTLLMVIVSPSVVQMIHSHILKCHEFYYQVSTFTHTLGSVYLILFLVGLCQCAICLYFIFFSWRRWTGQGHDNCVHPFCLFLLFGLHHAKWCRDGNFLGRSFEIGCYHDDHCSGGDLF